METAKEARPIVKRGEIWIVTGRKGKLTLRMLQDVDFNKDDFFQAEIVEGKPIFASDGYRFAAKFDGYGAVGTGMSFRTTLTTLLQQVALPLGDQIDPEMNVVGRVSL